MKSKTKPILAAAGYLWGGALITLLASLAVTMVYRMTAGGKNVEEYLAVGLITLPVQLLFGFFAFSRYGYRNRDLAGKERLVALLGGAGVHFLLCLPFHFSMYTAGVPALYLGEYLYRINTPDLPPEMAFTEIPLLWPLLVFPAAEGLTLLCAYLGFSRGQKKRERESNDLKTQISS
ncbi:MAG: hypothetical protein E7651_06670 [Ruminococcaceae bacterium]|nr:hypothetical protein [Oscillospiraceae bacterium]